MESIALLQWSPLPRGVGAAPQTYEAPGASFMQVLDLGWNGQGEKQAQRKSAGGGQASSSVGNLGDGAPGCIPSPIE